MWIGPIPSSRAGGCGRTEQVQVPRQPRDRCRQTRESRTVVLPPESLPWLRDDVTALIQKGHHLSVLVSDVFVLDREKFKRPLVQQGRTRGLEPPA